MLDNSQVVGKQILHIDGLRVENLLAFLVQKLDAGNYLPDKWEERPPSRIRLANMCMFFSWALHRKLPAERNSKSISLCVWNKDRRNCLKWRRWQSPYQTGLHPYSEILEIYQVSLSMPHCSTATKGRSHLLLNTTKKEKRMKGREDLERKMSELAEHNSEMKEMIDDIRSELNLYDLYNVHGWDGAESCENHGQKDEASGLAIPNTY